MDKRVFGLDVLRALAISFVLLTHGSSLFVFQGFHGPLIDKVLGYSAVGAFLGVEIFFVLSGFLIGSILLSLAPKFHDGKTLHNFWQRRWLRTLPNYFLFLGLNIWYFNDRYGIRFDLTPYFFFLQNWSSPQRYLFLESWSLAVEEWFYLLFPLAIFVLHKKITYNKTFLIAVLIFILVPSFMRFYWLNSGYSDWDSEFRKIVILRLDSVIYGVLAAWVKLNQPKIWEKIRFVSLVLGLSICAWIIRYLLTSGVDTDFAKTFLFSLTSLGSALLLPFADQWNVVRENFFTLIFRYTAYWSYSLYLVNLLIVQLIAERLELMREISKMDMIVALVVFFVSCFLLSAIVYYFWERPFMNLRKHDVQGVQK